MIGTCPSARQLKKYSIPWFLTCNTGNSFHPFPFLSVDGTFLLFSKKQEIRGVDLQSYFNVIPALTVPYVYNPLALDFHMEPGPEDAEGTGSASGGAQRLYWVDDDAIHGVFGIHSAFLNGTGYETIIDSGECCENFSVVEFEMSLCRIGKKICELALFVLRSEENLYRSE